MVPHIKGNIFKNIFVCLVQRIPGWETNVYSNTSQSVLSSQDQPSNQGEQQTKCSSAKTSQSFLLLISFEVDDAAAWGKH